MDIATVLIFRFKLKREAIGFYKQLPSGLLKSFHHAQFKELQAPGNLHASMQGETVEESGAVRVGL